MNKYIKDIGRISRMLSYTPRKIKLPSYKTSLKWLFPSWLVLTMVPGEQPWGKAYPKTPHK